MTQEQKAEAYSKAVEKAKQEYNTTTSEDRKQWLEELFPELKESEDELTWLTRYIEEEAYYLSMDIRDDEDRIKLEKFEKSLAWLKKQGEQKPDYCHHEVDLSNCSEEYRKAYYDGWNNCNMQHSQCQSESNDVVKCLINGMKFYYEGNDEATWGTDKFSMKVKDILSWLKKQGEKPQGESALEAINEERVDNANKVEPKFHEGDWVIDKQGMVYQVANVVENVTNHTYGYDIVGGGYFNDNSEDVRLWTIQDAKNGDVLVGNKGSVILMFRRIGNIEWDDVIDYHCYYDCNRKDFIVQEDVQFWGNTENSQLKPATKEQRDTLFAKMKESDYEWDDNKKELKKIEPKPADEVEPKFHEGEWVVDNCDYVWKIEGIINQFYILEGAEGGESRPTVEWVNKTFHLWTIEDAKDGDALVASDGSIFLFAGVVDCACKYYVALATDGYVKIKEAKGGYWETSRAVYPATKEQRDKLEKAMADAGYTLTSIKKN